MTYEQAKAALEAYFSDTTRSVDETREGLEMLALDLEEMMQSMEG